MESMEFKSLRTKMLDKKYLLWRCFSGGVGDVEEGARLAREFMRLVNESAVLPPTEGRKPTVLMPPTTVVKAQVLWGVFTKALCAVAHAPYLFFVR